jgi:hypothetical protein
MPVIICSDESKDEKDTQPSQACSGGLIETQIMLFVVLSLQLGCIIQSNLFHYFLRGSLRLLFARCGVSHSKSN